MVHTALVSPLCLSPAKYCRQTIMRKFYKSTRKKNVNEELTAFSALSRLRSENQEIRVFIWKERTTIAQWKISRFFTNFHRFDYLFKAHFYVGSFRCVFDGVSTPGSIFTFGYEIKNHNSGQKIPFRVNFYRFRIWAFIFGRGEAERWACYNTTAESSKCCIFWGAEWIFQMTHTQIEWLKINTSWKNHLCISI